MAPFTIDGNDIVTIISIIINAIVGADEILI
jgi:hypothetical protein